MLRGSRADRSEPDELIPMIPIILEVVSFNLRRGASVDSRLLAFGLVRCP